MYILHFISSHFSLALYTVMPHKSCFLVYQKAPQISISCYCYWVISSEKSTRTVSNY